jgi:hypothetical protein
MQKTDKGNSELTKLDLFRENVTAKKILVNDTGITADSALKQSAVVGLATQLHLVDSTISSSLYLYNTEIKSVEKGRIQKVPTKIYFIAYNKLQFLQDNSSYRFYFIPFVDHRIIKSNLAVQWLWCPGAPFYKSLDGTDSLSKPARFKSPSLYIHTLKTY